MTRVKKPTLWGSLYRHRVAYTYIAPFYLLFLVFGIFPIVSGLALSFMSWNGIDAMRFVGVQNYVRLLSDELFWMAMGNTVFIGLVAHVFILGGGLVLAYILNSSLIRWTNLFKTLYFLPVMTSAVASVIVFATFFSHNNGLINVALESLGLEGLDWWGGDGSLVKVPIIVMFSWQWIGWNMVIYLAGMQGINKDIYEAASIDGASHVQVFFQITIPLLKPIILFTVVQSTIGTLNLFTEPYLLTGGGSLAGGTGNQGMTVMMYLLNKAPWGNNLYGLGAAVAYVISAIVIAVSLLNMKVFDRDETAVRKMK